MHKSNIISVSPDLSEPVRVWPARLSKAVIYAVTVNEELIEKCCNYCYCFFCSRIQKVFHELVKKNCSRLLDIPEQNLISRYEDPYWMSNSSTCPPWFTFDFQRRDCKPGHNLGGIIHQDPSTLQTSLLGCYCMTEDDGNLTVGACIYACSATLSFSSYYPLPCNVSQLWDVMCADLKREGCLCGKCVKGHTIPVYSHDCIKCENYRYNWMKYLAVAFLPTTIFYILVTLFSISFTSPTLSGIVLAFQIAANPIQLQLYVSFSEAAGSLHPDPVKIALSFAAFFNLDFFSICTIYSVCIQVCLQWQSWP